MDNYQAQLVSLPDFWTINGISEYAVVGDVFLRLFGGSTFLGGWKSQANGNTSSTGQGRQPQQATNQTTKQNSQHQPTTNNPQVAGCIFFASTSWPVYIQTPNTGSGIQDDADPKSDSERLPRCYPRGMPLGSEKATKTRWETLGILGCYHGTLKKNVIFGGVNGK